MTKYFRLICIWIPFFGYSQNIPVSSLKAPSSPAFSVLGIQPNQVNRPKTYNDLEISILNNFLSDGKLLIPNNYAIEFSPYWLFKHKSLGFLDYLEPSKTTFCSRSLAFSAATNDRKDWLDSSKTVRQLSFGGRITIPFGAIKVANAEILNEIYQSTSKLKIRQTLGNFWGIMAMNAQIDPNSLSRYSISDSAGKVATVQQFIGKQIQTELPAFLNADTSLRNAQKNEIIRILKSLNNQIEMSDLKVDLPGTLADLLEKYLNDILNSESYRDYVKSNISDKIKQLNTEPYGTFLELASAGTLEFPNAANTDFSKTGKVSLWATLIKRFRPGKNALQTEWLFMVRESYDQTSPFKTNNLDAGLRGLIQVKNNFTISVEGLFRNKTIIGSNVLVMANGDKYYSLNNSVDWRLFLSLEYRLTPSICLNYGIGRDFNKNLISNGNLLSILGLNFGFGGARLGNS